MVLLWAICSSASLNAAPLALVTTRSARSFEATPASLVERGLAFACLSLPEMPDRPACNPALNAAVAKPTLELRGLLASGYTNLNEILDLTKGTLSQEALDKVFADDQFLLETEADVELSFRSRWFSLGYRPLTASGIIVARNEANPDIEVRAVKGQSFYGQSSVRLARGLNVGLRASYMKLTGVSGRFRLTDGSFPKARSEYRIYLEPGASYELPFAWRPRVAFFLARLGYRGGSRLSGIDTPLSPELGVSVSPPLYWGSLDLSLEYRDIEGGAVASSRVRGGAMYRLGAMAASLGVDKAGISTGVYALIQSIGAGILFSTNRVPWRSSGAYTQTMYSQIVWSF